MTFSSIQDDLSQKISKETSDENTCTPLLKLQTLAEQIYQQEINQDINHIENFTTIQGIFESLELPPLELERIDQNQKTACCIDDTQRMSPSSTTYYGCLENIHVPLPSELHQVTLKTFMNQLEIQSQQIYQDICRTVFNHKVNDTVCEGDVMGAKSFQEEEPLDKWLTDDKSKNPESYKKQLTIPSEIQYIDLTFLIPPKPQSNTPFSDFILEKRDEIVNDGPIINPMDTTMTVFDRFVYNPSLLMDDIDLSLASSVAIAPVTHLKLKKTKKQGSISCIFPQRIPLDYEEIKNKESPLLTLKIQANKILKRQYFVENVNVTLQMMQTNHSIEHQRLGLFDQVDSKVLERFAEDSRAEYGQDIQMIFAYGSVLAERDEKRIQIGPERLEKEGENIYQCTVRRIQEQMPSSLLGCSLQIGLIWNLLPPENLHLIMQKEELPVLIGTTALLTSEQQQAASVTVEQEQNPLTNEEIASHSGVIEEKPSKSEVNFIETSDVALSSEKNDPVNNQIPLPSTKSLVDSFFGSEIIPQDTKVTTSNTKIDENFTIICFLNELSRSALWEMMQKKHVAKGMTFDKMTFHQLNTLYQQLQSRIRRMIKIQPQTKKKKATSNDRSENNNLNEITSVCQSFRQIIWLLALKTLSSFIEKVQLLHPTLDEKAIMRISVNTFSIEIGKSKFWRQAIGSRRWSELERSFRPFLEWEKPEGEPTIASSSNNENDVGSPPRKRLKRDDKFPVERDISSMARWLSVEAGSDSLSTWSSSKTDKSEKPLPVRVLCSPCLLYQNELLADELCTEYQVTMIERDYIGGRQVELAMMLLDEHHGLLLFQMRDLVDETLVKHTIYELVAIQHQFQKCWIILQNYYNEDEDEEDTKEKQRTKVPPGGEDTNDILGTFYLALIHFDIDIQPIMTFSIEETCMIIRQCLDSCASKALQTRKVLPRFWFERPFLLEEESQHERFLSSTRIMNAFAAQSLLQRHSLRELCQQPFEEFQATTSGILSSKQIEVLWSALHQNHGLNADIPYH